MFYSITGNKIEYQIVNHESDVESIPEETSTCRPFNFLYFIFALLIVILNFYHFSSNDAALNSPPAPKDIDLKFKLLSSDGRYSSWGRVNPEYPGVIYTSEIPWGCKHNIPADLQRAKDGQNQYYRWRNWLSSNCNITSLMKASEREDTALILCSVHAPLSMKKNYGNYKRYGVSVHNLMKVSQLPSSVAKFQCDFVVNLFTQDTQTATKICELNEKLDQKLPALMPSCNATETFNSKENFAIYLKEIGLQQYLPHIYTKASDCEFPCIMKPNDGYGGGGIVIGQNLEDLKAFSVKNYFLMEYIVGTTEYSVDFLCDGQELVHLMGRSNTFESTEYIKGHSQHSKAEGYGTRDFFYPSESIADLLLRILRPINYVGIGCLQYKMKGSQIKIFEINTRICGGAYRYPSAILAKWILDFSMIKSTQENGGQSSHRRRKPN